MSRLSLRLAVAFVAFVVAGSLALVFWISNEERRQSRGAFLKLADSNASFLQEARLPLTQRTAESLKAVLGVHVQFRFPGQTPEWEPGGRFILGYKLSRNEGVDFAPPSNPGLHVLEGHWDFAVAEIRPGAQLTLLRDPASALPPLSRTLPLLGVFWLISLALAAALARGIVVPLRALAKRLPRIADADSDPLPEISRNDEIGELARAYQSTRKQLSEERRAREQAERLATLGRMATGLAHEINNPVSAIKLHAQLLETESPSESLTTILGENAKIEALVNQWMFIARPQPPAVAPCDLAELVAESVRTVSPAAAHAKVRIVAAVGSAVENVDRRRINQAVCNILMNAIHAMAGGGELTISAAVDSGKTRLGFRDTGPGFSAAALAKATELFYSEKEGGMGIGLSVTAEIMKAHGGELHIENAVRGAVVTMVFPAKEGA